MFRFTAIVVGLLTLAIAGPARASLVGDSVGGSYDAGFGNEFDPATAVVGGGVEFEWSAEIPENFSIDVQYDFGPESLWVTYDLSGENFLMLADHSVSFTDLDWFDDMGNPIDGEIVGFNLVSGSAPELDSFDFTADSLSLGWSQIDVTQTTRTIMLHFEIVVEHEDTPAVPEPATVTLLGLGLGGIALKRLRRS